MATSGPQPTALFNRDFFLVWQGQVVSRLGNQAFLIASTLWTLEVTGSATAMGLMLTANRVATVVLGPSPAPLSTVIPDCAPSSPATFGVAP